jgi:antitoxin component HigA of HigAB toxin-antitoxin module
MPRVAKTSPTRLPSSYDELVQLHAPRAIADEVDYQNMQEIIDALTDLPKLTRDQQAYLDTLTLLFEAWENEHEEIDVSGLTPIDVLRHLMEQRGMNASDLGRLLGERSLGPKILNGDRELSKAHIRRLMNYFGVAGELFL